MKKQTVRTWGKIGLYVTLLFFGGVIGVLGRTYQLQAVVMVYFLLLTTMFAGRLSDRVVDGRVRRLLVASAWMMIVFFLLRGMKYYVFREAQGISRFLWYSYYVPILVLAALSVLAAVALDEDRREKILFTAVALGAVTGVLILLILTNDLHQLYLQQGVPLDFPWCQYFSEVRIWCFMHLAFLPDGKAAISSNSRRPPVLWWPVFGSAVFPLGLFPPIRGMRNCFYGQSLQRKL